MAQLHLMKVNKNILIVLLVLIAVASLYRIMPNRPYGFSPIFAMTLFGGAIFVKNKKWAFVLPLLSLFISDVLYQILYLNGMAITPGFYEGQLLNYALFGALTCIGFFIHNIKVLNVLLASIASPTIYFLISNFLVWTGNGGFGRPKTFAGLMQTYTDALPFYPNSVYSTILFSAILFGGYYLVKKQSGTKRLVHE